VPANSAKSGFKDTSLASMGRFSPRRPRYSSPNVAAGIVS
jgi:hypothetical protein